MERSVDRRVSATATRVRAEGSGGPRILLVEDDDDTRQLLAVALAGERLQADQASSAEEALTLLRRHRYDLVLTDYDLPGRTGASMLREAASEGLLATTATVVITAHPQPEGVRRAEVLRKPLDLAQFLWQVRRILESVSPQPPSAAYRPSEGSEYASAGGSPVELVLYVTAESAASQRARRQLESLLAQFDPSEVQLEVCDVSADPARGEADHVVFTPTLVTRCGGLATWVLGDLADRSMVVDLLHVCGVEPRE
jgi:DNA-binding response OmpR family regulator